jgi:hypothetical protein
MCIATSSRRVGFSFSSNKDDGLSAEIATAYTTSERTTGATAVTFAPMNSRRNAPIIPPIRSFVLRVINRRSQFTFPIDYQIGTLLSISAVADYRHGFHTIGVGFNITTGEEGHSAKAS